MEFRRHYAFTKKRRTEIYKGEETRLVTPRSKTMRGQRIEKKNNNNNTEQNIMSVELEQTYLITSVPSVGGGIDADCARLQNRYARTPRTHAWNGSSSD